MKVFYWNIRDLANNLPKYYLFKFCKDVSLDLVCLAEPMMHFMGFLLNFLGSINTPKVASS